MAKYIGRNLGYGERVVFEAKMHWACLLPGIFLSVVIIGIPLLIKKIITITTTELGFTNKKFVCKTGLINTKVMNSPLNKIRNVYVKQDLFGKIFGYGTVHVDSFNGRYNCKYIVQADDLRTNLLNAIEEYDREKMRTSAQEMASAFKGSASWQRGEA